MTEVNKYNHSKIYKICSNKTDKIYIGSTTQTLAKRLHSHVRDYRCYIRNNNNSYTTSYELIKLEDYYIVLIEECNYNNKQQLERREGDIIKLNINNVVNKFIAGRTEVEYYNDNKEQILERHNKYNNDNKEQLAEQQKKPFTCKCGSIFRTGDKSKHNKSNKHINFTNNLLILNELTFFNL